MSGSCFGKVIDRWRRKTKGHLRTSFIVPVDIWEERNERHEERWAETRAATLKNPLHICHCQGLSAGVGSGTRSNTNKQMKRSERRWDAVQGRHQGTSNSAENMTRGILLSWPILFQTQRWPGFLLFPVQKSVRLMERYQQSQEKKKQKTVMSFQQHVWYYPATVSL